VRARRPPEPLGERRVREQRPDRGGERVGIIRRADETVLARAEDFTGADRPA
jgi:hypothetical protein